MTQVSYLRDVVEEPHFAQDIDSFRSKYNHIEELHEWITNTLSANPRYGEPLKQAPEFYLLTTPIIADTPSFWVFYRFDENYVYLLSIEPVTT